MHEHGRGDWQLHELGREGRLIRIEQALARPDEARAAAQQMRFAIDSPFYPGVRAPLPERWRDELLQRLTAPMRHLAGDRPVTLRDASFALVCTPPAALTPPQRLPHFDGASPDLYACVLYLSPADLGGTAFFRHVRTGYEAISEGRQPAYLAALRQDIEQSGPPGRGYFSDWPGVFERTAAFDGCYNRLLLYPGNLLHSGVIANDPPPRPSLETGRLTITAFLSVDG